MRVLMVSPSFAPVGGAERAAFIEAELLRERGHEVTLCAFEAEGQPTLDYQVPRNTLSQRSEPDSLPLGGKAKLLRDALWNNAAEKVLRRAIESERPDIIHVHRAKPFSMAIFRALKGQKARRIMTLHDHYLNCPTSTRLYGDGTPCFLPSCRSEICIQKRCARGDIGRSVVSLAEFHLRNLFADVRGAIDTFAVPSRFMEELVRNTGVRPEQMAYLPNFVQLSRSTYELAGDFIAYVGRLSHEKGLLTLLDAARLKPEIPVMLIGDGPLRAELEKRIDDWKLTNVTLVGFKDGDELKSLIAKSIATVLPSECFENAPLSILESFALNKPVIGSDRGGIPELVQPGVTGYLFEPRNASALANAMEQVWAGPERARQMGRNGREIVEAQFCPDAHYRGLIKVYGQGPDLAS